MIEAIDLTKTFGATLAVDHITLTIKPGEVFCLLGANGAGKTTTINLFLNFVAPTSGVARIGGLNVVEHPVETKQRLAYIPEQVTLYRNLTGLENLRFFSRLARAHGGFRRGAARDPRAGRPDRRSGARPRQHLLEGHAAEGRHRDHDREGRTGAAARRADLGSRSEGRRTISRRCWPT